MTNIVYRQMPAPRELPQQIPAHRAKAWMQKPRVGANFWCKSPGMRGGMVMDEIDTCINSRKATVLLSFVFKDSQQQHRLPRNMIIECHVRSDLSLPGA